MAVIGLELAETQRALRLDTLTGPSDIVQTVSVIDAHDVNSAGDTPHAVQG